jgi:hypothetical protein
MWLSLQGDSWRCINYTKHGVRTAQISDKPSPNFSGDSKSEAGFRPYRDFCSKYYYTTHAYIVMAEVFASKHDFGLLGLSVAGITIQVSIAAFGVMRARIAVFNDKDFLAKPEVGICYPGLKETPFHPCGSQVQAVMQEFEEAYGSPMEYGYPDMGV